jgi:putative ABC transport system permease protein
MTFSATGTQDLHVVGTYETNAFLGDYTISLGTYDANVEQKLDMNVFLNVADGASVTDAKTKLDAFLQEHYPNVQADDQAASKQKFLDSLNGILAFVLVLLFLSVIISGFGILATLWLSVFERIRELGLLRAVGMSRVQVKRMVRIEAVIVAILGAILGIVIGIVFAWTLQRSCRRAAPPSSTCSNPSPTSSGSRRVTVGYPAAHADLAPARRHHERAPGGGAGG